MAKNSKHEALKSKRHPLTYSFGGDFDTKEDNAALKKKVDKIKPTNLHKSGAMDKYRSDFENKFGKNANK